MALLGPVWTALAPTEERAGIAKAPVSPCLREGTLNASYTPCSRSCNIAPVPFIIR